MAGPVEGVEEASAFLGHPVRVVGRLQGGEDAVVLRIRSAGRDWALRVSHEAREDGAVEWVSRWMDHVSRTVPQAVRRERRAGRSFFRTASNAVATVLPFIEGVTPEREDPAIQLQAAALLARIHRAGVEWRGWEDGPSPRGLRRAPTPPAFVDPGLDDAWRGARRSDLRTGPVHGDFYRGNLLATNGVIRAILDWDDARVEPLLLELAGATFEFSRDRTHRLDPAKARRFVSTYLSAGGPVSGQELRWFGTAMRVWVRRDACVSLAYAPGSSDYVAVQARAFRQLESDPGWIEELIS
jgi:Ser/Thr protein kinase RdoA (MazF antagonist)